MMRVVRLFAFALTGLLACLAYDYIYLAVLVDVIRSLTPDLTTRLWVRFFAESIVPSAALLLVSIWLGFWKDGFRPIENTILLAVCVFLPWLAGYVLIRLACGFLVHACL